MPEMRWDNERNEWIEIAPGQEIGSPAWEAAMEQDSRADRAAEERETRFYEEGF